MELCESNLDAYFQNLDRVNTSPVSRLISLWKIMKQISQSRFPREITLFREMIGALLDPSRLLFLLLSSHHGYTRFQKKRTCSEKHPCFSFLVSNLWTHHKEIYSFVARFHESIVTTAHMDFVNVTLYIHKR